MPKAPRLSGKKILNLLLKHGFKLIRVKGSHHFVRHDDGRCTVVVVHRSEIIGPGLLRDILNDTEMTAEELVSPSKEK